MVNRRTFVQTLVAASLTGLEGSLARANPQAGFGELQRDPARIIDLPKGFSYTVIARTGEEMNDGLLLPGHPDGMAAFPADNGLLHLVINHEVDAFDAHVGPWGKHNERLGRIAHDRVYDRGRERSPGCGGTSTLVYNPVTREVEYKVLSLAGTEYNCAGSATPWNSWLSCEESPSMPGRSISGFTAVHFEKPHGYVFEVPSAALEAIEPVPLRAMGRFEHECALVDPRTGIVYQTEDKDRGLFYRFIPNVPGKLHQGGKLQALAVIGHDGFDTRNWHGRPAVRPGDWLKVRWLDLENIDSPDNDLRLRGFATGAARFARGEGIAYWEDSLTFACTDGGPARRGQLFRYLPSPFEGSANEAAAPGRLQLFQESARDTPLRHADNITAAPWGDLIVCEDSSWRSSLVGVRPNGDLYVLARNSYLDSELAGACFSPDGKILFLNIQYAGLTLAVTGPWPT